ILVEDRCVAGEFEIRLGKGLEQIGFSSRWILRKVKNLGPPELDSLLERQLTQSSSRDSAGNRSCAGGIHASMHTEHVRSFFKCDRIASEIFSFRGDLDCGARLAW